MGAQVAAASLEQGVIARAMPHGDILGFAPPLCITKEEIDIVIGSVGKALDSVHSGL